MKKMICTAILCCAAVGVYASEDNPLGKKSASDVSPREFMAFLDPEPEPIWRCGDGGLVRKSLSSPTYRRGSVKSDKDIPNDDYVKILTARFDKGFLSHSEDFRYASEIRELVVESYCLLRDDFIHDYYDSLRYFGALCLMGHREYMENNNGHPVTGLPYLGLSNILSDRTSILDIAINMSVNYFSQMAVDSMLREGLFCLPHLPKLLPYCRFSEEMKALPEDVALEWAREVSFSLFGAYTLCSPAWLSLWNNDILKMALLPLEERTLDKTTVLKKLSVGWGNTSPALTGYNVWLGLFPVRAPKADKLRAITERIDEILPHLRGDCLATKPGVLDLLFEYYKTKCEGGQDSLSALSAVAGAADSLFECYKSKRKE